MDMDVKITTSDLAGQIPVQLRGHNCHGFARRSVVGRGQAIHRGGGGQPEGRGLQRLRLQEVPLREGRAHEVSLSCINSGV